MEHEQSAEQRYLKIYLQDHRAGAEGGSRLARRCREHALDAVMAQELSALAEEIDADRLELAAIMDGVGVGPSAVKNAVSVVAERIGRLKLNGRLVRPSPLRLVMELEALIGAVSVKRELWAALMVLAPEPGPSPQRLAALRSRAEDQRGRLQALHERVVPRTLGSARSVESGDGVAAAGVAGVMPESGPRRS
jgi:hypothetical protein